MTQPDITKVVQQETQTQASQQELLEMTVVSFVVADVTTDTDRAICVQEILQSARSEAACDRRQVRSSGDT